MTECPALETLSEFIDGMLSPDKKERVVAHLGDCADCYSVVSESLGIREEVSRMSRTRIKKYASYSFISALASAAILLFVLRILQPGQEITGRQEITGKPVHEEARHEPPLENKVLPKPHLAPSPRSFAGALAERLGGNNTAALLERVTGRQFKSGSTYGFSSVVTPQKAAFGIGAGLVDLEAALMAKDRNKTEVFAKKLNELLKPFESSYGVVPKISEQGRTSERSRKEADSYVGFSRAVETFFKNRKEAVFLRFGSWVEAATMAAWISDAAFFQTSDVTGFRQELEKSGVPVGTVKDLQQMESIVSSDGMQTDQFTVATRLLADIKEMYHLPQE